MTDTRLLDIELRRVSALRAILRAEHPGIDEQTLADTVEGLTNLNEMLAAITRAALEDETMMALLKVRMSEMSDRMDRFAARAERRRQIVRDAMIDANVPKLVMPDFTASLRRASPGVVIVDEKQIPQTFIEMRPHIRKRELLDALKDGAEIEGAVLSNPGMALSVRTR